MADTEDNIPTLTDIAHVGNQDMLNHFDGHQFDDINDDETDTPLSFENASDVENEPLIEHTDPDEIPSIKIEPQSTADISSEDFSEAMQSASTDMPEKKHSDEELKEKIDQAIEDALPGIQAQLKGKLYSKFGI